MSQRQSHRGVYHTTTLLAVVVSLLILFVTSGYFFWLPQINEDDGYDVVESALEEHRDRWSANRPLAFRYVLKRSCACDASIATPYIVIEERGARTAEFLTPLEVRPGEDLAGPDNALWIDDIFVEIEKALGNATELDVAWDERFGFPTRVEIRYPSTDAWYRYEVRDFEVLEYGSAR